MRLTGSVLRGNQQAASGRSCQLTGHFPSQKYERSSIGRGVTQKMIFAAISDLISPSARLTLLDAVIFNVLICNSDSHSKNYSVLIGAGGSAKMAPLYDLMCAAVYRQVDQILPQGIAGRDVQRTAGSCRNRRTNLVLQGDDGPLQGLHPCPAQRLRG